VESWRVSANRHLSGWDQRRYGNTSALLFELLNEMDGLNEDSDIIFLLTTNRADILEPAPD
jgi:ATP-dependent 26S proteasome regulatory subunit